MSDDAERIIIDMGRAVAQAAADRIASLERELAEATEQLKSLDTKYQRTLIGAARLETELAEARDKAEFMHQEASEARSVSLRLTAELAEAREQLAIETRAALDCNDALAKERAALAAARAELQTQKHNTLAGLMVAAAFAAEDEAWLKAALAAERVENQRLRDAFVAMEKAYNEAHRHLATLGGILAPEGAPAPLTPTEAVNATAKLVGELAEARAEVARAFRAGWFRHQRACNNPPFVHVDAAWSHYRQEQKT
jgi:chromosome segregation ATPase